MSLAAALAVFAFAAAPAEAGFHKRAAKAPAAKAAPAPAKAAHAGCPLRDMMAKAHARLAARVHHARPARAERPAKVVKVAAKPAAKSAPKK